MALTNFNIEPYNDDFDPAKRFYKILFRPSFAVQARELTQIQSILQNQLKSFGEHVFKDGTVVIPGSISINLNNEYVRLQVSENQVLSDLVGKILYGSDTHIKAEVVNYAEATTIDPPTIFVKYLNTSDVTFNDTDKVVEENYGGKAVRFIENEILKENDANGGNLCQVEEVNLNSYLRVSGKGSSVIIEEGVYFIDGFFVNNDYQELILDKYFNTPSYKIGFSTKGRYITSYNDTSLNDNATGVSNSNAPGADRYTIDLSLIKKELTDTDDTDFVKLLELRNGLQDQVVNKTDYNILEETLARRTYDESGNYTVTNFDIDVREHRNTGGNRGIYIPNAVGKYENRYTQTQSNGLLALGMSPGKAYVYGYEVENPNTKYITISKAREYDTVNLSSFTTELGNYFLIELGTNSGLPQLTNNITTPYASQFKQVNLHDAIDAGGNVIGTANVRYILPYGSNTPQQFKLGLFNINLNSGKTFENIKSFESNASQSVGYNPFVGNVVANQSQLFESKYASPIYKLPNSIVKSLKTGTNNTASITYYVQRTLLKDTGVQGQTSVDFTVSGTETFSDSYTNYIVINSDSAGSASLDITDNVNLSISAANQKLTISPTAGTFSHNTLMVVGVIKKTLTSFTTFKNKTVQTVTISSAASNVIYLTKTDIIEITSITDTGNNNEDVTARYTLDNGIKDTYYGEGKLTLKSSSTLPTGPLSITFTHYSHGSGDFFCVDSYPSYETIPEYSSSSKGKQYLRDSIDFRPSSDPAIVLLTASGDGSTLSYDIAGQPYDDVSKLIVLVNGVEVFDATTSLVNGNADTRVTFTNPPSSGTNNITIVEREVKFTNNNSEMPLNASQFLTNFTYYLPRIDSVGINSSGKFVVSKGVPTLDPQKPILLDNTMILYYLYLPAYTYKTSDIKITPVDNRRYTMRDIGKLEKRIKNVEYYTQLSLLEQNALNTQIQDNSGLDRFKNGIFVDNFKGHNVGDVTSPSYRCSIDMMNGELRPEFTQYSISLIEKHLNDATTTSSLTNLRNNSNYQKTGELITLPYSHTPLAQNTFATKSVNCNPFLVFQYIGDVKLTPEVDEWFDTETLPDLIVQNDHLFDSMSTLAQTENNLGTVWNNWQTEWSGVTSSTETFSGDLDVQTTITTREDTLTRTGISRELTGSSLSTANFGERVVNTTYIPFIRTQTISFSGSRLKPNTRVYPFFDEVNVGSFCYQVVTDNSNVLLTASGDGSTLAFSGLSASNITPAALYVTIDGVEDKDFTISGTTITFSIAPESGTNNIIVMNRALITDDDGNIEGKFIIPNTNLTRFRTGERVFRLTSSIINAKGTSVTDDEVTTFADTKFIARGMLQTKQKTIQSTRVPIISTELVSDTNIVRTIDNVSVNASAQDILNNISNVQETTLAAIADVAEELGESIQTNANDISNLTEEVDNNLTLINSNAENIEQNAFNIEDLDQQMQEQFAELNRFIEEVASMSQAQIDALNADIASMEAENASMFAGLGNDIRSIQNNLRQLRSQPRILQQNITQVIQVANWVRNTDPLAQTFINDSSGGCFVTKVDLYFKTKDSNIPIKVYLTPTNAGRPSDIIIPFSEVTVPASSINVSEDATVATTVTFPSPVYLEENKEYAVVLKPKSQKYEAWVSRLGENEIGTTRRVTRQPLLGSLFRSQNARLWTEDQYEDLKFTMYKAVFKTNTVANVDFVNNDIETTTLPIYSFITQQNSKDIIVIHKNHGMTSPSLGNSSKVKFVFPRGTTGGNLNGIPITELHNQTFDIQSATLDRYIINTGTQGSAASITGSSGPAGVVATKEINFQVLQPQIGQMVFDGTKTEHYIKTTKKPGPYETSGYYQFDPYFYKIIPNDNYYFKENNSVLNEINETEFLNRKSLLYRINLFSANKNLSPVIDTIRTNLFAISNRLSNHDVGFETATNTYIDETNPSEGSAVAKYLTKEISLANPSTQINLILTASINSTSSIKVYYKVKNDDQKFNNLPFIEMPLTNTPTVSEQSSQSPYNSNFKKDFSEHQYEVDLQSSFTSFIVKIVMKGTNPAFPPRISDLRGIVLA